MDDKIGYFLKLGPTPELGEDDPSVSHFCHINWCLKLIYWSPQKVGSTNIWVKECRLYASNVYKYINRYKYISYIYIYVYKYTYGTHERTIHIYQFRYAYNTFSGTLLKYLTSPDITWQAVALAAVRQNGLALQCLDETSLGSTRSQMFPIGLWYIYIDIRIYHI